MFACQKPRKANGADAPLHYQHRLHQHGQQLPKAELDEASNDERFPDSFHVEINLEMCISTDNLSCASSSSLMLTQRDRDIPSNQIKLAGQRGPLLSKAGYIHKVGSSKLGKNDGL